MHARHWLALICGNLPLSWVGETPDTLACSLLACSSWCSLKCEPLTPDAELPKLALYFEALKQVPDLKKLAGNMQHYLFNRWIGREMRPDDLAKTFGLRMGMSVSDPRVQIIDDYAVAFVARMAKRAAADRANANMLSPAELAAYLKTH
jgi:hypothetical protein